MIKKTFTKKLDELLASGLVCGSGDGEHEFCAEQAIAFAAGEKVTDHPACSLPAASIVGRRLNDANWPSNEARAKGMRQFMLAQFGSTKKDPKKFAKAYARSTAKELIPLVFETLLVLDQRAIDLLARVRKDPTPADLRALSSLAGELSKKPNADRSAFLPLSAKLAERALRNA